MISRRSFLAAVAGAVGASALPAAAPVADFEPVYWPYQIWDTAVYTPGLPFDEVLFPGPVPREFTVESMGLVFPADLKCNQLAGILRTVSLSVEYGPKISFRAPLFRAPVYSAWRLPVPLHGSAGNALRFRLHGAADLPADDPVPIQLVLQGLVLMSGRDSLAVA